MIVLVLLPPFAAIRSGAADVTLATALPDLAIALAKVSAFAVLMFVVGMAFDPKIVVDSPLQLLATLGIIILGKSVAAVLIVLALRQPLSTGLRIAASLAQIGEFSFILGAMGVSLGLMDVQGQGLILGGALASIVLHPVVCRVANAAASHPERAPAPAA